MSKSLTELVIDRLNTLLRAIDNDEDIQPYSVARLRQPDGIQSFLSNELYYTFRAALNSAGYTARFTWSWTMDGMMGLHLEVDSITKTNPLGSLLNRTMNTLDYRIGHLEIDNSRARPVYSKFYTAGTFVDDYPMNMLFSPLHKLAIKEFEPYVETVRAMYPYLDAFLPDDAENLVKCLSKLFQEDDYERANGFLVADLTKLAWREQLRNAIVLMASPPSNQ
jgi:hypothetical protein